MVENHISYSFDVMNFILDAFLVYMTIIFFNILDAEQKALVVFFMTGLLYKYIKYVLYE